MQITIDTKKDSPEEIKKAIHLLSVLVQGKTHSTNIFENDSPSIKPEAESGNAFANIFGADKPIIEPEKQTEKEEEIPRLMEY
ncbi:hypothetical protein KY317_02880 [Candidatus Woesearchaeota archaeon]|nr:hypothetical protein [Candidatus Woesearchaeota archaeon]